MIIQLIIIGVIIVTGGILFFPDIANPIIDKMPTVSTITAEISDDLKYNINDVQNDIDETFIEFGNKIDEVKAALMINNVFTKSEGGLT